MAESEEVVSFLLVIIGILITLIAPLPVKDEYRLFIITTIIFIFLVVILSRFDERLKNEDNQIKDLNKRFKTIEELNDIRLNIKELQRKVFK